MSLRQHRPPRDAYLRCLHHELERACLDVLAVARGSRARAERMGVPAATATAIFNQFHRRMSARLDCLRDQAQDWCRYRTDELPAFEPRGYAAYIRSLLNARPCEQESCRV